MEVGGRRARGEKSAWIDPDAIPVVTVAIVVKNAAGSLAQTLRSVLDQDYRNLEVVAVDGKSEDGTNEILRRHEDRLDLYVSEPDEGIYAAMNKAVDLATGEYLNFMNAGDSFVTDNSVTSVFDGLADRPDLVFGDAFVVGEHERRLVEANEDIQRSVYRRMPFCHQSLFTRVSTLRRYRFNSEYRIVADFDFVLRCLKGGCSFRHVPIPVANYRLGGYTKRNQERAAHEFLKSLYDNGFDEDRIRASAFLRRLVRGSTEGRRQAQKIHRQAEKIEAKNERIAKLKRRVKAQAEKLEAKNELIEELQRRREGAE